jgi:hypothetical protein
VPDIDLQRTGKSLYGSTLASQARQRKQPALRDGHQARRLPEVVCELADQLRQWNILPVRHEESLADCGRMVCAAHEKVHQIIHTNKRPLALNCAERQGPTAIDEIDKPQEIGTYAWTVDEWRPNNHELKSSTRCNA